MMLKSQERSQPKPYVIALRSAHSRLASLHSAKLLYSAMVCLYGPSHTFQLHSLNLGHFHFIRRPVFNIAVFGNELEYLDETISLQMEGAPRLTYLNFAYGSVASSIGVNLAITLELCQPKPPQIANSLEIIETSVPAIEQYTFGTEAAFFGRLKHLAKMIVLRLAICRLVIEAIITGYVAVAIGPQKRDEIYTANHLAMFARPVAAYEFDLFGVLLIKSRIVQHQYAAFEINLMARFLLEVFTVGFDTQQQTVDGIVRRGVRIVWLHPCCFCAAIDSGSSNQKVNVIVFIAFWGAHSDFLHYHPQPHNSY
jgi:hypothetical protein